MWRAQEADLRARFGLCSVLQKAGVEEEPVALARTLAERLVRSFAQRLLLAFMMHGA